MGLTIRRLNPLLYVIFAHLLWVVADIEPLGKSRGFFANALVLPTVPPAPRRFSQLACKSTTTPERSPTTSKSSVGRLVFCYERLKIQCPNEEYLRETPSLAIAADLKGFLSELAVENGKTKLLPEKVFIAVLDAYMVAYRDVRKNKGNREHRSTDEYSKGMDTVVDGMQSTLSIFHQHDQLHAENDHHNHKDEAFRSVDPYATILHMLLELTLDDAKRSVHWATKSVEVLVSLESNPRVAHQTKARLLQYNKVLKGLASSKDTIGDAVYLLDQMCSSTTSSSNHSALQTAMDDLGSCLNPDAKSFATVLTSQHLESQETIRGLVEASRSLGMYEGYLKGQLKKCFGEDFLSKLLGE